MCDCITKSKSKIVDHLKENPPEPKIELDYDSAKFTNTAFIQEGNKFIAQFSYPLEFRIKSGSRKKTHVVDVTGSFCPFCGEKLNKGD